MSDYDVHEDSIRSWISEEALKMQQNYPTPTYKDQLYYYQDLTALRSIIVKFPCLLINRKHGN